MFGWWRVGAPLVALALGASACGEVGEQIETAKDPLFVQSWNVWPVTPVNGIPYRNVPVCWDSPNYGTEKNWVRDQITKTWQKVSLVRFTGWGTCTATSPGIRIRLANENPRSYVGAAMNGMAGGMTLNFDFTYTEIDPKTGKPYQPFGGCLGSARQGCIRSIGAHEFGHALGFIHEQNRADTPQWCPDQLRAGGTNPDDGSRGDTLVGNWDATSVMNYCNAIYNNDGKLSPVDAAGVRRFYGRPHIVADYTADGRDDYAMFLRDTAEFSIKATYGGTQILRPFGDLSDLPLNGDYDGDGKTDFASFRARDRSWRVHYSSTNSVGTPRSFGDAGDKPLVGDFDGDGRTDLVTFGGGIFKVRESTGASWTREWSAPDELPVIGDYDGDARDDIGSFKNGWWTVQTTGTSNYINEQIGAAGDKPVPGDYDGDGRNDVAVWRPSTGKWTIKRSSDGVTTTKTLGISSDTPVPADYDGDGKTDIAYYRTSNRTWSFTASSTGTTSTTTWGASNSFPVQVPLGNR